jgi:hypothetical protein
VSERLLLSADNALFLELNDGTNQSAFVGKVVVKL